MNFGNLNAFGSKPNQFYIVVKVQEIFKHCCKGIFKVSDAVQVLSRKGIVITSTVEYITPLLQALPATLSSTSVRAHLPPAASSNAFSSTTVNMSSMEQVNIMRLRKQANRKEFVSISNNLNPQPPNALKVQGYSGGKMSVTEKQQARPNMATVPFSSGAPLVMHHPPGKQPYQIIPLIHPILPLPPVTSGPR